MVIHLIAILCLNEFKYVSLYVCIKVLRKDVTLEFPEHINHTSEIIFSFISIFLKKWIDCQNITFFVLNFQEIILYK